MLYFNDDSYQSEDDLDSETSEDMIVDDLDLDVEERKPKKKRIREKLDHLSHEEKLLRRKMKNRISAQSARDRKKNKMQALEKKIEILCKFLIKSVFKSLHQANYYYPIISKSSIGEDRQKILKENAILKRQNDQIILENSDLKKRLNEIESKLSVMSNTISQHQQQQQQQLPIQINSIQTTTPLQCNLNNRIDLEESKLRSNIESTSIKSAELINGSQQKHQVLVKILDQKMFNSKINKRIQIVKNKELQILIKQLISSLMIMMMNVKTCSTGSKAHIKICLIQTLKKLRLMLTKQQMKVLLTNVINRQLMMDLLRMEQTQKLKARLGQKAASHYQKSI